MNPCELLEWDSAFFGRRIGRLRDHRLTPDTLANLDQWVVQNQIDCVYFLCEAMDSTSVMLAEHHRFHLVDIRVTLESPSRVRPLDLCDGLSVRQASGEHADALKAIARRSHTQTRFYQDAHFEPSRCDALYETWIEKSCNGYSDMVFTAALGKTVAGYITCHLDSERAAHIGLLAVAEAAGGRGVGSALVRAAVNWFDGQQRPLVTVVTQGANIRAQRLYQRCGFVSQSVELWYHYWPAT